MDANSHIARADQAVRALRAELVEVVANLDGAAAREYEDAYGASV